MKILNALMIMGMLLSLCPSASHAASRRREEQKVQDDLDKSRQELQLYQRQLEDVRVKRWQDKRNAVAAQEAFSDAWNEIKTDIDRLGQMKDQKEETLLRLQNQETEKRREVEEQENRLKQFGLQVRDKLGDLGKEWENGFPYRSVEKMASQARLAAGYLVRMGQAYEAFVSTESEDVAILGKTGRLDGQAWEWIEDLPDNVRKGLRASVNGLASGQGPDMVMVPMDVLLTKATGEGFTTKARGTFWKTIEHEFDGGGWVMWPIMALMLSGILIVSEKILVFLRRDQDAGKLADRVQALAGSDRIPEAIGLCRKSPGSVGRVLLAILERADGTREDAESQAHEVMLHESPSLEKRITTMNILAAASPLVGLLGTVSGIVRTFQVISAFGTGNQALMLDSIAESLMATQNGLLVAFPLLLMHPTFRHPPGRFLE